jgi:endonuclease/exonuclease/phosphatase family metal-dependent hydrolase
MRPCRSTYVQEASPVLERREMYLEPIADSYAVAAQSAEISVLTYNVEGLPWPIALGRGRALRAIGRELGEMRREGRQPDVVLIQEGFRSEIEVLVRESGYAYWAQGPSRSQRPGHAGLNSGLQKFASAGLHVLSDIPIAEVKTTSFANCAGYDCFANKGAMLVRLAPQGLPTTIDVVNTHLNARKRSKAPKAVARAAHNAQMRELNSFVVGAHDPDAPLLVGGDFNVKKAPERYYYDALERPYTVVSEYCLISSCPGQVTKTSTAEPWLASQDLQAFRDGAVQVRPVRVEAMFDDGPRGERLSDHDGYLVRYRLSWTPATTLAVHPRPDLTVKPQLGKLGFKVAWKR